MCFVYKNQSQAVKRYLAAIKYFHEMFAGWDLPTSHCMIVAVGKGIDKAHGSRMSRPEKKTLTWAIFFAGNELEVMEKGVGGLVTWLGLALPFLLLCRASEL